MIRRSRYLALLAASALLTLLSGCSAWGTTGYESAGRQPFNGGLLTPPKEIAPFALKRMDGKPLTLDDTTGRTSLFFFGYTTCPDVCPLTLVHVRQMREALGERSRHMDSYFVTVDPERDTPEVMAAYLARMEPGTVGLTGAPEELARAQAAFGVIAQRRDVPTSSARYFMDHTAAVFLVDEQHQMRLVYPYGMTAEQMTEDLKRILPR
ncbi:MAG: SCO family protein [Chloroflexota bacterium]